MVADATTNTGERARTQLEADGASHGSSASDWHCLHQGGRYDSISGLYYFRCRDYSPGLGKWMQPDPAGYVDGANVYEYVGSSPTGSLDPLGLCAQTQPTTKHYQRPDPPPDGPWMDELRRAQALAEQFNKTAPAWKLYFYECNEQATDIQEHLRKNGPWKYWDFSVIGATGPKKYLQHHVVNAEPTEINPARPYVIDGFHGLKPFGNWWSRGVKLQPRSEWEKEWPNYNRCYGPPNPRRYIPEPTTRPTLNQQPTGLDAETSDDRQ